MALLGGCEGLGKTNNREFAKLYEGLAFTRQNTYSKAFRRISVADHNIQEIFKLTQEIKQGKMILNSKAKMLLVRTQQQTTKIQNDLSELQLMLKELNLHLKDDGFEDNNMESKDEHEDGGGVDIYKYRHIKPQKINKDGYSFGDRVTVLTNGSSKVGKLVGWIPKKGKQGTVVGTTHHYVDILFDKKMDSIRKKNTSIAFTYYTKKTKK